MYASNLATDTLYTDPILVAVCDRLNAGRTDHDFYLSKLPPSPAQI